MKTDTLLNIYQSYTLTKVSELNKAITKRNISETYPPTIFSRNHVKESICFIQSFYLNILISQIEPTKVRKIYGKQIIRPTLYLNLRSKLSYGNLIINYFVAYKSTFRHDIYHREIFLVKQRIVRSIILDLFPKHQISW